jgi:5'-phosphate synthase pdxT subunit
VTVSASATPITVGVLALQGGVREHLGLLGGMTGPDGRDVRAVPVRRVADLVGPDGARVDALVLPGGESSVIDRLARMVGLADPLRAQIDAGMPVLGTCAGLILLAREVANPAPGQRTLGVLDVTVDRNAFGPQIASAEAEVDTLWGPVRAAFIRAPRIVRVGAGAREAGRHQGQVVAVAQGDAIGIAFHPELTGDTTVHRALLDLV